MVNFNALVSRMKYIPRWSLMRQSRVENVAEHTTEVMQIAHTLAIISKENFGKDVNAENIVLCALYHDISEILTGDMPTPVKYNDEILKNAYKDMEKKAVEIMLNTAEKDAFAHLKKYVSGDILSPYEKQILKAADKFSALIKCIEEMQSGNCEFKSAFETTKKALENMNMPEVDYFTENMLAAYYLSLDELAKI